LGYATGLWGVRRAPTVAQRAALPVSRVFTPQNRMRIAQSLCRVWRQVVVCRETTSLESHPPGSEYSRLTLYAALEPLSAASRLMSHRSGNGMTAPQTRFVPASSFSRAHKGLPTRAMCASKSGLSICEIRDRSIAQGRLRSSSAVSVRVAISRTRKALAQRPRRCRGQTYQAPARVLQSQAFFPQTA